MTDQANGRREPAVTRRGLLRFGAMAAGVAALGVPAGLAGKPGRASGVAGPAAPAESDPAAPDWFPQTTVVSVPSSSTPPPAHVPPAHHPKPSRPIALGTWNHPIRSLDDILARSPHTRLPRNAIMLTIDDGPHPVWTPKYLRLLATYGVPATFCLIGRQVLQYPSLVRAAVSEGHDIANHTFTHPMHLPQLSTARIHRELEDTNDAIVRATGHRPRQFRAPGGVWGADVFAEASRQEMLPLGWDVDPRDWSLPGVDHIRTAMLAARPHDIVLCHDGGGNRSQTFAALSTVIPALLARGFRFVKLPPVATV